MGLPAGESCAPAAAAVPTGATRAVVALKGCRKFSLSPSEGERAGVRGKRTFERIVGFGRRSTYFGFRANSRSWEMCPAKRTFIFVRTSSGTSAQSFLVAMLGLRHLAAMPCYPSIRFVLPVLVVLTKFFSSLLLG